MTGIKPFGINNTRQARINDTLQDQNQTHSELLKTDEEREKQELIKKILKKRYGVTEELLKKSVLIDISRADGSPKTRLGKIKEKLDSKSIGELRKILYPSLI